MSRQNTYPQSVDYGAPREIHGDGDAESTLAWPLRVSVSSLGSERPWGKPLRTEGERLKVEFEA